jgi:hypothetical protein
MPLRDSRCWIDYNKRASKIVLLVGFSQDVRPRGEAFGNGRVQRGVYQALLAAG